MTRRRPYRRDDRGLLLPRVVPHRRKPATRLRSKQHRDWLATQTCRGCAMTPARAAQLRLHIDAAHLRAGTDGGTGIKPSDYYCWPGCTNCHRLQHALGEPRFFRLRGIADPVFMTLVYAARSPCPRIRDAGAAEFHRRYP